jgi:hypothetical protein
VQLFFAMTRGIRSYPAKVQLFHSKTAKQAKAAGNKCTFAFGPAA